jgi:hypothetical protein
MYRIPNRRVSANYCKLTGQYVQCMARYKDYDDNPEPLCPNPVTYIALMLIRCRCVYLTGH